jgi:hypothetical protein
MENHNRLIIAIILFSLLASLVPAWAMWFSQEEMVNEPATDYYAGQPINGEGNTAVDGVYSNHDIDTVTDVNGLEAVYLTKQSKDNSTAVEHIEVNNSQYSPNTPPGSNVIVMLSPAIINFETITAEGTTTLILPLNNTPDLTIPDSLTSKNLIDIATTATYSGKVEVGIHYDENAIRNENHLSLLHWTGTVWEDATSRLDMANDFIYGEVDSLSWFYILEQSAMGNDPPALATITGGAIVFTDKLLDIWIVDNLHSGGNCPMDREMTLEVTCCGEKLWPIWEQIMFDSVLSWKYWLPSSVDAISAACKTLTPLD